MRNPVSEGITMTKTFAFEVKDHEGFGRIGKLKIGHRTIETPFFFPVVRPDREVPEFLKKYPAVITNAYIFYRRFGRGKRLREILNFRGAVMTDSGAYQLMIYGKVDVKPAEILEVQSAIGSDLGVILDIPPKEKENFEYVQKCVKETLRRAKEAEDFLEKIPLVFPLHGSPYPELLRLSAEAAEKSPYPMVGLGSIVPTLIEYQYPEHVRALGIVRRITQKPLHMFGLGHPSLIPLAVYMGADTFDSASYVLFAEDERIITPLGTRRLKELKRLPPWASIDLEELKELPADERKEKIAEINFKAIVYEVEKVKQAIEEGRLLDLVLSSARIYPQVAESLKEILGTRWFRGFYPKTHKRAFIATPEKLLSEVVSRYVEALPKLMSFYEKEVGGLFLSGGKEPKKFYFDAFFGPVPYELGEVWPFFQRVEALTAFAARKTRERLKPILKKFRETDKKFERDIAFEVAVRSLYQLGKPVKLPKGFKAVYGPSGRLKEVLDKEGEKLFVFRAKDGFMIPQKASFDLLPPLKFIEVPEDVIGKDTVLAKGIKKASAGIIPGDIVEMRVEGVKKGLGRAVMNSKEMRHLNGVAVKVIFWN